MSSSITTPAQKNGQSTKNLDPLKVFKLQTLIGQESDSDENDANDPNELPTKWAINGKTYQLIPNSKETLLLPNYVYAARFNDRIGFYLEEMFETFRFDYKLYNTETELVNRIIKTFNHTKGNFGVIFNGINGTGKTVTSKQICNGLGLPVIIIERGMIGIESHVNRIKQDLTVFVDEYEKIYNESHQMLTIMDGAVNSEFRRFFMLTTNNLHINENLRQRPSRVRYLKTFKDLNPRITEQIVDDILIHKELKMDTLRFISSLEIITIDIVKAIVNEVNIHHESPEQFKDIFNVEKLSGQYNVSVLDADRREHIIIKKSVSNFNRYDSSETEEYTAHFNNYGYVFIKSKIDTDLFKAELIFDHFSEDIQKKIKNTLTSAGIKFTKAKANVVVRIEQAFMYNKNYSKEDYGL